MKPGIVKKIERCDAFFRGIYDEKGVKAVIRRAIEVYDDEKNKLPVVESKGNKAFMAFMDYMIFVYIALKERETQEVALEIAKDCLNYSIDLDFENSEELRNSYNDYYRLRESRKRIIDDVNRADEEFGWIYKDANYLEEGILYSFNVTRCGMYELCKLFEVEELMPSICQGDFFMIKFFPEGVVFHREGTLADGADCCDFLYTCE